MKLEEEFVGRREQFAEFLRIVADQLSADNVKVRGQKINLPDVDMEYKIRHKSEFAANKLSISIEWLNES